MTPFEHRNLVTRFVHDGDGDVTNLKLPNREFKICYVAVAVPVVVTMLGLRQEKVHGRNIAKW